ncbi:MAG TPA: GspH/FimT family pseudopilin [Burkholderiales bacterium]|jgi:type IV fimbrial biogenesis protein FimT
MLSRRRPAAARGFTIIEVLISLVVLGVLVAMAGPSFFGFMQNSQIRAAANAMQNGLQVARANAIARNLQVQLAVGPGSGWTVSEVTSGSVIQTRVHEEGTPNVGVNTLPAGAFKVTFTPLGAVTVDPSGVTRMDFVNPSGGGCETDSPAGNMRCLRIVVTGGGSIKMCDPKLDPAATPPDPRACP